VIGLSENETPRRRRRPSAEGGGGLPGQDYRETAPAPAPEIPAAEELTQSAAPAPERSRRMREAPAQPAELERFDAPAPSVEPAQPVEGAEKRAAGRKKKNRRRKGGRSAAVLAALLVIALLAAGIAVCIGGGWIARPGEGTQTAAPEATAVPETTAEPEAIAEPEATAEPEAADEPETTAAPEEKEAKEEKETKEKGLTGLFSSSRCQFTFTDGSACGKKLEDSASLCEEHHGVLLRLMINAL